MQCPNCHTENSDTSRFCIRCGLPFTSNATPNNQSSAPTSQAPATNANMTEQYVAQNQATSAPAPAAGPTPVSVKAPNFLALIIAIFIKPITTLKEELPKFASFKNSGIMAIITTAIATIFSLITTIFSTVYYKHCSLFSGECEVEWEWDNLENIEWFELIIKQFFGFLVVMVVLAAIFFAASRIFKQTQTNFPRTMAVVALAFLPITISFLAPTLSLIHATVGMIISTFSIIYGLCIFYEGMSLETKLENDKKIYYLLTSVALIMVAMIVASAIFGDSLTQYVNLPSSSSSSLLDLMNF